MASNGFIGIIKFICWHFFASTLFFSTFSKHVFRD